ncbi:uncharacterized protein [Miscanthus floridulus]|uniref:uncharacterized protein isoform X2 n=1 Tax=Miscanthus floridulus TaxID=154761 RepID=UPI003458252A
MPLQHGPRVGVAAAAGAARARSLPGRPTSLPCRGSRTRTRVLVLVAATTREGAKTAASAADVVREFYDGVNRRDLAAVEPLIAEGCVYEDLVFPRPFVGRERIIGFFGEFMGTISPDLQFVIDDISTDDSAAVGVTWHLEWRGRPFPFSRGCSFYRLLASESEQRPLQIVYEQQLHLSGMAETAWSLPPSPGIWHW